MDRLDTLEAQSVYILREAYAAASPLAALWSVGKDSNVVIWLARKAFYGRVPFPVVQLDTAMELDEVYAYRDQYTKEWDLDLVVIDCPPESEMDPDLPPMTRAAARKSAGLAKLLDGDAYKGIIVGIRRDEEATRAKERCSARARWMALGNFATSHQNSGTSSRLIPPRGRICAFIRCCTGPRSISGATPSGRTSPSTRSISAKVASAIARSARKTSLRPSIVTRRPSTRLLLNLKPPTRQNAPAA